jgi:serine acetyltransferase
VSRRAASVGAAGALRAMVAAIRADHAMLHHYDGKYASEGRGGSHGIARDVVSRIGFQMLAACRVMRFCADAGIPGAPRVAARFIRHLYGADVHWDAELAPGIVVVHGMGLAISGAARIESGAILFQNVTLGMSGGGAPVIERDVHIGAGSTVVGGITVGARSKITGNCFVRESIPPDSLVEAPPPTVSVRQQARPAPTACEES